MVSEAKKAGNKKWDSAHMTNIACRVRKETAEQFKAAAAAAGTTPNAILKKCIDDFIKNSGE